MNSYKIYTKLALVAENNPEKLIEVWNERCYGWRYYDDVVYTNDIENLKALLPSDPEEAFALGRQSSDGYNYTDDYLSIDGYGRPVTCNKWALTEKFIMLGDLSRYLADEFDDIQLQGLFEELGIDEEDEEEEE